MKKHVDVMYREVVKPDSHTSNCEGNLRKVMDLDIPSSVYPTSLSIKLFTLSTSSAAGAFPDWYEWLTGSTPRSE